jgi:hypothetical protein
MRVGWLRFSHDGAVSATAMQRWLVVSSYSNWVRRSRRTSSGAGCTHPQKANTVQFHQYRLGDFLFRHVTWTRYDQTKEKQATRNPVFEQGTAYPIQEEAPASTLGSHPRLETCELGEGRAAGCLVGLLSASQASAGSGNALH